MKKRILIIDDERDLGDLIKNVLIKEGYLVDNAFSLEEAGEKLKFHPEVILLDNNLPDGSGLQYLKDHYDLFPLCSVIIITSDPQESFRLDPCWNGITAFLQKPFTMKSMRELINKAA